MNTTHDNTAQTTSLSSRLKDQPAGEREGYLNPFCHLVIKVIRWDSPPLI